MLLQWCMPCDGFVVLTQFIAPPPIRMRSPNSPVPNFCVSEQIVLHRCPRTGHEDCPNIDRRQSAQCN